MSLTIIGKANYSCRDSKWLQSPKAIKTLVFKISIEVLQMKKSIILSLAMLFSACATPYIEHTQDNLLQITMNDKLIIKGEGNPLFKNTIKLLNLTIQQRIFLMDDDTVLTYEDATASMGYRYNYGIQKTVSIIFPQYNYELIDIKGNIHFFTLKTNTNTEYLILENMNKKRIKMIYGLDKKTL